ncbi:MAG: glycosyltransferase family 4 protein [Pseudonocardiaceae bacterium]
MPGLLKAGRLVERPVEVVLAEAGFESAVGAQHCEWDRCRYGAAHVPYAAVRGGGLPWAEVPGWLAGAAVVIVPSLRETFGLVALEAMSVGTPVVAYDVGNLPALLGTGDNAGGVLVPRCWGEQGLWSATTNVLTDPLRYADLSRAAYYRSRDYQPATVAENFVKAVR